MGFNYFGFMQDRYSTKISTSKVSIVKLDGKDVTKNLNIDMFNYNEGGFAHSIIDTAKQLSNLYDAIVFVSTDEISLLFYDSSKLERIFDTTKTQKISSLFSQHVARIFNDKYKGYYIYFDAKTFCIPEDKVKSYIVYKEKNTYCVSNTYLAKRKLPKNLRHALPLSQLCDNLERIDLDIDREDEYFKSGLIFYRGQLIDRAKLLECDSINYKNIRNLLDFNSNIIE